MADSLTFDPRSLVTSDAWRSRQGALIAEADELKGEAAWQSKLAEIVRQQGEEIDRLNLALTDANAVPPRRPVLATGSIAVRADGAKSNMVTVIDDHGTIWTKSDRAPWQRLDDLPSPIEIAKTLKTPAEEAAEAERKAERERMQAERAEQNRGYGR